MDRHVYENIYRVEETHWWYVGRRRIIASVVEQALAHRGAQTARPRILDVGCGTGRNLRLLARYGEVQGLDASDDALAFCRARGLDAVERGDASAMPFPDARFDLVTALDVLEHLDDDAAALREIARVLRPGGAAVLFVPAFAWLWGVQDDVSHHRRRYTLPELEARVRAAGLAVERGSYANLTFLLPTLAGRVLMRATGIRPASDNDVNIAALNGVFGRLLGAERHWLRRAPLPLGVSAFVVARKRV